MHTHPSEPLPASVAAEESLAHDTSADPSEVLESGRTSGRRRRRTDWREGGSTVRTWREMLIAWSVLGLGAGVLAGYLIVTLQPTAAWAGWAATGLLWLGMLVPIVIALRRSRPAGLLRFRPSDVLLGLGFGAILRLCQGLIQQAVTGQAAFPGMVLVDGRLPISWWFTDALAAGVIGPVIEEFFFRVVLLVAIYTVLRRPAGHVVAGLAALLISSAVFVVVHLVDGSLGADAVLSIGLVGVVCAMLVLVTGRIWPAVLAHVVYNVAGVGLVLIGTFAA